MPQVFMMPSCPSLNFKTAKLTSFDNLQEWSACFAKTKGNIMKIRFYPKNTIIVAFNSILYNLLWKMKVTFHSFMQMQC